MGIFQGQDKHIVKRDGQQWCQKHCYLFFFFLFIGPVDEKLRYGLRKLCEL